METNEKSIIKPDEQAFEWLIERALVGTTKEERGSEADFYAQSPEPNQFYWGRPTDFNKDIAIDTERLWSFLEATQADLLKTYVGTGLKEKLPRQIAKIISSKGVLEVLRGKIDFENLEGIMLFYPKPSESDSEESKRLYALNQFSVTRQQTFSKDRPGLEIDMVIYVNGLPLFTIELKSPWTHQTARVNGIKQFKEDRDPKQPLLNFGRCLAHFVIDKDEVFFTTRLKGKDTYFMPYNKGLPDGQGAGNPVNPNGYKTAYIWEQIFTTDTISDIIQNFALFDYGEWKKGKRVKVAHVMKNVKKIIFPRYHQLDVVDRLVADVEQHGVGKRYLIQHSAGSGKSNSLTWLAYKLISVCAKSEYAVRSRGFDAPLFDSVIVVTDRRNLDSQITDNIKSFGKSEKTVQHADSSSELKTAIENNKRIIITTIQKFPYICSTISDVSDHNFAIIIDEAHSSQSGVAADKMNATTERDPDQSGLGTDELIEKMAKDRKMSSNCSYFAFTATPKRETLEKFGIKKADGRFDPFHLYSMKQAIEEGFILNVLTNYTTYKSYYEVVKSIEDNPDYNSPKAQKALKMKVERNPQTIAIKSEIIIQHFDSKVYRSHKLAGKGKAMVATKDIECAIRYYKALMELKDKLRLPYNIIIAFSGTKKVDGIEYTEAGINGFPDTDTAVKFDENDNIRILVVANKYLTGFDQSKLCAMYIDKPLDGVLAVQALSRLNRTDPSLGKRSEDLFILDFFNKTEGIKAAFDDFYTATTLSGETNVNILHELRSTLLSMGVFEDSEVKQFMDLYIHGAEPDQWNPIIDTAVHRFDKEIEWAEGGKADFKMKCKQFVKVYSRIAAIITYEMVNWESLYWFLRYLIPCLKVKDKNDDDLKDLLDSVDLNTYGLRRTVLNQKIELDPGESVVDPLKPAMVSVGGDNGDKEKLDKIIKEFNDRWFKGWNATPEEQKSKLVNIANAVKSDSDYQTLIVGNPDQDAVENMLMKIIDKAVRKSKQGDMSLYKEYQQNEDFKYHFRELVGRIIDTPEYIKGT